MNTNPYVKTNWRDHIVDIETGQVIQEGTRFTASRANNIEEGIYTSYEYLRMYSDEITKLRIQLEMLGRAPTNNGTFFDPIDDEGNRKALSLLQRSAISQSALNVGATVITVDKEDIFEVGQTITIYDEENSENKVITKVVGNKITVSALTKASKKGAIVSRGNVVIKDNKMLYPQWGNYNITVKEVI